MYKRVSFLNYVSYMCCLIIIFGVGWGVKFDKFSGIPFPTNLRPRKLLAVWMFCNNPVTHKVTPPRISIFFTTNKVNSTVLKYDIQYDRKKPFKMLTCFEFIFSIFKKYELSKTFSELRRHIHFVKRIQFFYAIKESGERERWILIFYTTG